MIRFPISLFLFLVILVIFSCSSSDETPPQDDMTGDEKEMQYGTPFADVPDIEDIVMYEINLRAFSPGGNIQGVINKLDHIEELGVNVIWLMPIHPIGIVNSVNSPYSVRNYKAVSTEYGTLEDLRNLTDEAHSRGIAVIMDWVANHTSWDNGWIENKDWYSQDQNGNIIHPPGTNWMDVADLNYNNLEMRAAMINAMQYWIYEANIDGFRCDNADGVPFDFWREAWNSMDTISGREFIFFAEGSRSDHFTAGFDLNFGWESYGAIKEVFNGQDASEIFTAHESEYSNIPDGKHWIRFTTNHDESAWDATPVSIFNGVDGALAASVISIFTGGVPLIYGSQEVGTAQNVPFFSNSTINWNQNPGMLDAYQKMLQFYESSAVSRIGLNSIFPDDDIACFKKTHAGEELLILANTRNSAITFVLPPELKNTSWTNVLTSSDVMLDEQIIFDPYQFFILN